MEKKQYLDARLRRDFIRYVILRTPEFDNKEISRRLNKDIAADYLYQRLKERMNRILDRHLGEYMIKDENGETIDVLPDELSLDVVDDIEDEYRRAIAREYDAVNFMPALLVHIEKLTWRQGVDDMAANLRAFRDKLHGLSSHYASATSQLPTFYNLEEKYKAARRITVRERVMQDNDKDIADFLESLRSYCRDMCGAELVRCLSELYADIADSRELDAIIRKYEAIEKEALEAAARELPRHESSWDAEYEAQFPTGFYSRNIEDIDASEAFRMGLSRLLARRESCLKGRGFLTPEGELRLFTSPAVSTLASLTEILPSLGD